MKYIQQWFRRLCIHNYQQKCSQSYGNYGVWYECSKCGKIKWE